MMGQGKVNGYMCQGFNPIAALPDKNRVMAALAKLKWLVVMDPLATETSEFWRNVGPYNDVETASIQTEVIRLPTTCFAEEDGSLVNSSRWLQWHWKGADGPGEARTDVRIMSELFLRLRQRYQANGGAYAEPILKLDWPYKIADEPSPEELAREINGYAIADFTDAYGRGDQGRRSNWPVSASSRTTAARLPVAGFSAAAGPRRATRWPVATTATRIGMKQTPGLGLGLAGEPADSLQPRFVRPARQTVGREQTPGVVERQGLDRHRRAGLQGRLPTGSRDESVHHEPRRRGAVLRPRQDERRAVPGTL